MTDANNQPFVPTESPFRDNYSNLVLAIWSDPDLENQIIANPAMITQFGFTKVPQAIYFEPPGETVDLDEYEAAIAEYEAGGEVTFYIPEKPTIQPGPVEFETLPCCCCTPCCCSSSGGGGGRPPGVI